MTVPISNFVAAANTTAIGCLTGYSLTGSNASNMIDLAGTWNTSGAPTGIKLNITNTASGAALLMDLQVGGFTKFKVNKAGLVSTWGDGAGQVSQLNGFYGSDGTTEQWRIDSYGYVSTTGEYRLGAIGTGNSGTWGVSYLYLPAATVIGWAATSTAGSSINVGLYREAAGVLAQRADSAVPQTLRVYNTYTDASNYERGVFDWGTSSNVLTIGAQATGGTLRNVALVGALITIPGITTDAAHTDSTVCQDTTTHALYAGSGLAGICLGTSSIRFKENIVNLNVGLKEILALEPISFRNKKSHGIAPGKTFYGFTAEQGQEVLPMLVGPDTEGRPQSFDYLGVVPVLVSAMQEQQELIEELRAAVEDLRAARH